MNYIVNLKKPASLRNLSIRLTYYAFVCFSERNKFLIYTIIIVNISIARNQTKSYLILKKNGTSHKSTKEGEEGPPVTVPHLERMP